MSRLTLRNSAACLAVLAALLYLPSLWNGFVGLDDGLLIYKNPAILQLTPASVWHVFTSYDPELYIPLTLLTYQIEHALFGLQPFVYHLTNIVLFAATIPLVFRVAYELSGKKFWVGILCAALFAVHPIHVETVAWAAARKDLLANVFFFGALATYVPPEPGFGRRRTWSLILFFLGLLAKVSVATLPAVLFLLEKRDGKSLKESTRMTAPFFGLSAIFLVIAYVGKQHNIATLSLLEDALLFCKSISFALWKMIAPFNLSVLYEQRTPITPLSPEFAIPLVIILLLAVIALVAWRRSNIVSFAILFVFITFLPTLGTFSKNHMIFYASDRYAYLPSFSVLLLIALFIGHALARPTVTRWLTASITLALLAFLAILTVLQQRVWLSTETLYVQAVSVTPTAVAYTNLGGEMIGQGKTAEAEEFLKKAVELDPANPASSAKLGKLYALQKRHAEALPLLQASAQATDARPILSMEDFAPYYFLGEELLAQNKIEEGLEQFRHAVARGPDFPEPHYNLGVMYSSLGDRTAARDAFEKAVAIEPRYISAAYHLARIYGEEGRLQEARELLRRIVAIAPQYENAAEHLENIERLIGR